MKWSHDNRGCEGTIYHIDYIWFAGACLWTCAAICILWGARGSSDSCWEVSRLFVFVLRLLGRNSSESRASSAPPGGGRIVLVVHCCLFPLITVHCLSETLFKVFWEKRIEDGIHCRVGILQTVGKQDDNHQGVALLSARWLTDKRKLGKKKIEQNFQDFFFFFFLKWVLKLAWVTQWGSQQMMYTVITVRTSFVTWQSDLNRIFYFLFSFLFDAILPLPFFPMI